MLPQYNVLNKIVKQLNGHMNGAMPFGSKMWERKFRVNLEGMDHKSGPTIIYKSGDL